MFHNIVVAFDGSDHSERALQTACDLASHYKSNVDVLNVPELHGHVEIVGGAAATLPPTKAQVEEHRRKITEQIGRITAGQTVDIKFLDGPPTRSILTYIDQYGADLIVTGRRGRGALPGLLLGSVTQKLSSLADCAVLTVK